MNRLTRTTIMPWGGPRTAAMIFVGFLIFVVCVDLLDYRGVNVSLIFFHAPWPWRMAITLIQAGLLTAIVFRSVLMWFWEQKTKSRFWAFYLFFLALHCTIWGLFLWWPLPLGVIFSIRVFAIIAIVEVMLMAFWYWLTTVEPTAWPW